MDNLVLINKIKEQLMAEKIRPPHLPPTSVPSQQPLLVPPSPSEGGQHMMSIPKLQQVHGLHSHGPSQPDIALHARPASSTVSGIELRGDAEVINTRCLPLLAELTLSSRCGGLNTSEAMTPPPPTSSSQSRLGGASSPNLISGLASGPGLEPIKSGGLSGLLGAPPKPERGRKKIKAENSSGPLLVVPYPILASGNDQSTVTIASKEGKMYRCKVCPLTFFTKSDMQMHSKSHTEAKPHKCPHCSKSFANASYLAQHLRIHLGVKPYHCSYCEKSFRQLSHLQQHTRIHTGDRPYKCAHPSCEKAFTQLSNLQRQSGASDTDQSPAHHRDNLEISDTDQSPAHHRDNLEISDTDQSPAHHRDNLEISVTDQSPAHHRDNLEISDTDQSPAHHRDNLEISVTDQSPAHHRDNLEISDTDQSPLLVHQEQYIPVTLSKSHQRQHNKDKPYKCPNCYRAYSDSASLQIHLSAHAIKNAKAYCCSMCGRAYTSETYLMKHMSKHTVVEHLVNHHSPPRTESPSIPIRISLI
ncbi:UNVERIFIED_CONTAM: hypothetical protein FKN15_077786 [Acipenser sinensis]